MVQYSMLTLLISNQTAFTDVHFSEVIFSLFVPLHGGSNTLQLNHQILQVHAYIQ
jgi:hypothetical protein